MGRQESPLSRESILTTKEKDSQTVELTEPKKSNSDASVEGKRDEKSTRTSATDVVKLKEVAATETKNSNVDKGIDLSSPHSESIASKSSEKSDRQPSTQTDNIAKAKHPDAKQAHTAADSGAKEKKHDSKQQNVPTDNMAKSKQPDAKSNTLIDHTTKNKQQESKQQSVVTAKHQDGKQHSATEALSKGKVYNQQGTQESKQQSTPTEVSAKAKQPDSKSQSTINDSVSKAKDRAEDKTKSTPASDKANSQKEPNSVKLRKGSETADKAGIADKEKLTEAIKPKGQAPPAPAQILAAVAQAPVKAKSGPTSSYRTGKEEKAHLEALEENPMSPSSCSPSPSSNKSRPMSPGDKTSFVTQLTSVAKTVLGPMKGGSQEGVKVKDGTKTSEERRGNTTARSETGGGGRRGGQAAHSDKANSRSSKHH